MNAILAIAGADAAERTRRFTFLVTIIAALYGGYLYAPDGHAGYVTVAIDGHRGVYNAAWMGAVTAVLSAAFLTLVGFFLVRGSIERDRELRTGDIVAASPVRNLTFVLGKFASNAAVLIAIAAVMYGAGFVMQFLRNEDRRLDVPGYLLPFALVTIPSLTFVAAIAVVFDLIKPLRGALGSVVYFFAWTAILIVPVQISAEGTRWTPFDPFGTSAVTSAMASSAARAFPHVNLTNMVIGGTQAPRGGLTTFAFDGIHWSAALVAGRLAWLLVAVLLVALASVLFDRYAASAKAKRFGVRFDVASLVPNIAGLRLYRAELAVLMGGANIVWWAGAAALAVASAVVNGDVAVKYVLPIAFIWPIERWSGLGCRERRWGVEGLVASAPRALVRTLFAQWAAAATVGVAIVAGFIVREAATGNFTAAGACIVAVAAIAAAAIGAGVVSGTPRLFEGVYLVVWYLGPINHLAAFDFSAAVVSATVPLIAVSSAVAAVGLSLAFAGRMAARYA